MGRRVAWAFAALMVAGVIPAGEAATDNTGDYTDADVLLTDTVWEGTVSVRRSLVVPTGVTLTIRNATVLFETGLFDHFGFLVETGGTLLVQDSLLMQNGTGLSEYEKARRYWNFYTKGRIEIVRSEIRHAADIAMEIDGTRGSLIEDSRLVWMSRGVHLLRTNLTGWSGWDLVLRNVVITDMPVVTGGGLQEIGGAVGVLNGNVLLENVTIERARTTGLFVDRSAVSRDTGGFGNRVVARDLLVVSGPPAGVTGQGALLSVRTTGSFECERCTFVSPLGNGMLSLIDGHELSFRDLVVSDATLGIKMPADANLAFDGVRLVGPGATVRYYYGNDATPTWSGLSFDAGAKGGVLADEAILQPVRGAWWGAPSGPRDDEPFDGSVPASNPGGAGRPVVGTLDYGGWLTQAPTPPALALALAPAPERAAPGTTVELPFTLRNVASEPLAVDLRAIAVASATVSPARLDLAPGETGAGVLRLTIAPTIAPGSSVGATLLAQSALGDAAAHAATTAAGLVPLVHVASPAPQSAIAGAFRVSGSIEEPLAPGPGAAPSAGPSPPDADGDRVDDRAQLLAGPVWVIVRHDGREPIVEAAIEALGGRVVRSFALAPYVWAILDAEELPTLAGRPGVLGVWWDEPLQAQLAFATRAARARTSLEGTLPGSVAPDADYGGVWQGNPLDGYAGPTGRGVLMAVIDSGIDVTHNSVDDVDDDPLTRDPKVIAQVSTFSVLATNEVDLAASSVVTPGPHGTAVAGTAAGTGAGFLGPPGQPLRVSTPEDLWLHAGAAPQARIVDIDAFEETGVGEVNAGGGTVLLPSPGFGLALQGFQAVSDWNLRNPDDPIRIVQISLSLAGIGVGHPFDEVANALAEEGVLVVVAVGNLGSGAVVPASASKVIAVGATTMGATIDRRNDAKASFSNVASAEQRAAGMRKPEIMAPGAAMLMPARATLDGYGPRALDGTSFAAPLVSGVAALVLEANPGLHAAQVKEILIRSSEPRGSANGALYTDVDLDFEDDVDDGGWDPSWGFGYLDAEEAVRLARATTPRAPAAPPTLVLHAGAGGLTEAAPASSSTTLAPATWARTFPDGLSLGDGDAATEDLANVVLAAPTAAQGPTVADGVARLLVDGEIVAETTFHDHGVGTTSTLDPIRVPLVLGHAAEIVERGPDAGRLNVLGSFGVLDARGVLALPPGAALALEIDVRHAGAGAPVTTGPSGTRLSLPLDPLSRPNGEPPTAVSGLRATWDSGHAFLTWGPAGDDLGLGAYEIQRDGAPLASVPPSQAFYADVSVAKLARASYRVRAVDIHGAAGPWSDTIVATFPALSGRSVVVDVAGTSVAAVDAAGDGSFSAWHADVVALRVGRQILRATLFEDGDAVHATSFAVTLTAPANLPPTVAATIGPLPVRGLRAVAVAVDDPNGLADVVARRWRVDGGAWSPVAGDALALDARVLADGAHTLEVEVEDTQGAKGSHALAFESGAWAATIAAPPLVDAGLPLAVGVALSGVGAEASSPTLRARGALVADVPLPGPGLGRGAVLPAPASGIVRLEVAEGPDVLGERTLVADAPPEAAFTMTPERGSRLDAVTLVDTSTDDSGLVAREWRLPGGATSDAPVVLLPLRDLAVGSHVVTLEVTNLNGLSTQTSKLLVVDDLPTRIDVDPPRVLGSPVAQIYAGERVALRVAVVDPEGDVVDLAGGVVADGVLHGVVVGQNAFDLRPMEPGELRVDVVATEASGTTSLSQAWPVLANSPPVASLAVDPLVRAGVLTLFDGSASHDPDRAYLERSLAIEGHGVFTQAKLTHALRMGAWNATLTVVDSSGASSSLTTQVVADDWLVASRGWAVPPTLVRGGVLALHVRWHDGTPVEGAEIEIGVRHVDLGFERSATATTSARGDASVWIGTDLPAGNVPGRHVLVGTVRHPGLPGAPIQDEETYTFETFFDLAPPEA